MCKIRFRSLIAFLVWALLLPPLCAANLGQWQDPAIEDPALLTLEQVQKGSFIPTERGTLGTWRDSGATCLRSSKSETVEGGRDLLDWNPETDEERVLVTADQFIPEGSDKPLAIRNREWSQDRQKILLYTNTRRVWRVHSRGDYWVLDLKTHRLQQLGATFEPSTLMFAKFSPDATRVAYVHKNNVYVENLKKGGIKQLTQCDKPSIVNGTVDWVYEEEFGIRDGFRWSPNGKKIAYLQFDTEGVGTFHLVNYLAGNYSQVIDLPYPKVGTTNSSVRVGIVSASARGGGETTWLDDLPGDPRQHYIPRFGWTGNSKSLWLQRMNRLQNTNTLWMANLKKETLKPFFVDQDETWVYVHDHMTWLNEGRNFLWLSEMDGWRHFYTISRNGKKKKLITKGAFDVIRLIKLDVEGGWLYYTASPDHLAQAYLYRERLDGAGQPQRLTPASAAGTHEYRISGDARRAFHTYTGWNHPPVYELVSLPDHKVIKTLEANEAARERMTQVHYQPTEYFTVEIEPGVTLPVTLIKPYNFDATQKYPVLISLYGEPMGAIIKDVWRGNNWRQYLAQQGYLLLSIENRGTNLPLGRAWRHHIYRKIGILASQDQAAALRKLKERFPFIDGDRVAVTGFSGGGSMSLNLLFRYPELYSTAMAGGFISDQRLYDSIYQERFMGLPDDNAENYLDGSPITHAKNLQGNLLIYHGTQDDNCHYQSFENLVNELIKHQKMFTAVPYTGGTHGIGRAGDGKGGSHNTMLRTWYLMNHVKPGPLPQ